MTQQRDPDWSTDEQAKSRFGRTSTENEATIHYGTVGGQANPASKKDTEARKRLDREKRKKEKTDKSKAKQPQNKKR